MIFNNTWIKFVDFLLGQAAWWGCLLSARAGWEGIAPLPPLFYAALHLVLRRGERSAVLRAALLAALFGALADSSLAFGGLISFPGSLPCTRPWMVSLWAAFGVQLTFSLRAWATASLWARVLSGALAGPLAYRAGAALSALFLPRGLSSLAAISVVWALALGILPVISKARTDKGEEP